VSAPFRLEALGETHDRSAFRCGEKIAGFDTIASISIRLGGRATKSICITASLHRRSATHAFLANCDSR